MTRCDCEMSRVTTAKVHTEHESLIFRSNVGGGGFQRADWGFALSERRERRLSVKSSALVLFFLMMRCIPCKPSSYQTLRIYNINACVCLFVCLCACVNPLYIIRTETPRNPKMYLQFPDDRQIALSSFVLFVLSLSLAKLYPFCTLPISD